MGVMWVFVIYVYMSTKTCVTGKTFILHKALI